MQDYKINNEKVSHVVTHNVSNFGKAFRNFSNHYLNTTKDVPISDQNYLRFLSSEESDSGNENIDFSSLNFSSISSPK